jgi:transglutaminase-like putative cysteine protease
MATVRRGTGRCGEETVLAVAALRAAGIPARQVYTPRWAHTESNHAWVEAWADGEWVFIGACEPEPVLNLGWFNAPASRAMLTHTKVFGNYDGPEEVVLRTPGYTEINLIDNYAKSAEIAFRVLSEGGAPVEGARVDFCIYNSSQFYPAVSKYTDADGRTALSAGVGDVLVWAS